MLIDARFIDMSLKYIKISRDPNQIFSCGKGDVVIFLLLVELSALVEFEVTV